MNTLLRTTSRAGTFLQDQLTLSDAMRPVRWIVPLFWVALSMLVAANAHSQQDMAPTPGPLERISIFNFNLRGGSWNNHTLEARVKVDVDVFRDVLKTQQLRWDLVGFNENEFTKCFLDNPHPPRPHTQIPVHGPVVVGREAVSCLGQGLGVPPGQIFVRGELGIFVNTERLEILGPPLYKDGLGWQGSAQRSVLAVPVRVRANGSTFLFATTHIITAAANERWRQEQVEDLVQTLVGWDMPVVIAGDFNCSRGDEFCLYVSQSFSEAANFKDVEHISLLKPFLIGRFENHREVDTFYIRNLTDHIVTYAELVTGTGSPAERNDVVGTLHPGDGYWGGWTHTVYCKGGSYAYGYRMRTEKSQGGKRDDTALNAVELRCRDKNGAETPPISPHPGFWGDWHDVATCNSGEFLVAASMQIERPQGGNKDDTAANQVAFRCSGGQEIRAPAETSWGDWGAFDPPGLAPANTAICGFYERLEGKRGDGDDTALNGLRFLVCRL
jgi:hypothetical protein